jgi:hypothetical protein
VNAFDFAVDNVCYALQRHSPSSQYCGMRASALRLNAEMAPLIANAVAMMEEPMHIGLLQRGRQNVQLIFTTARGGLRAKPLAHRWICGGGRGLEAVEMIYRELLHLGSAAKYPLSIRVTPAGETESHRKVSFFSAHFA